MSLFDSLLSGKRILVTGGSRGLGRAFCEAFARHGARVALTYSKDSQGAQETRAALGAEALSFQASVLDARELDRVSAELESKWGGIDILVNNAGVSQVLPLALIDESDWDRVLDTNLKGTYLATRSLLRGMIRRKSGVILNVGSLAGVRMLAAPVHYAASKAGQKGFTEALAKELNRYGIRVNCIAPGLLEEGVASNLPESKLKEYVEQVALRRVGNFGEVAELAAFMVSDRNGYMNGATVIIDGGL